MPAKFITLSFCFLVMTACFSPTPRTDLQMALTLPTEPPTLDWNRATDNVGYQILNQLMEGLTQYNDKLEPVPAIAQSWEILDNGTRYLFHLDPSYRWSDGRAVVAQDFHDSWIRLLNPETSAEYAYFLFDIVGAREFNSGALKDSSQVGIKVLSEKLFEVRLKKPIVFFPAITTFMVTFPIRSDVIKQYGDRWTEPQNLLTCGPFVLDEWWHEYRLTLKVNPYFGGAPKPSLKELTIYLVSDSSTALALYEKNLIDFVLLPPMALDLYRRHPDFIFQSSLRGYYYAFNQSKPPYNDVRLRRALAHALDKSILPKILRGGELSVNSWIPPKMFGFNDELGLKFNPAKARTLLRQVFGATKPPTLALNFNSDATNNKVAQWAQAQWSEHLGLNVEIINQEWKTYLSELKNDPPGMFRLGWGADYPDPDNFMNLFTEYSGNNHTGWKNPAYSALIAEAATTTNPEHRQQLYNQAQKLMLEEAVAIIPLFVTTQNMLVRKNFRPFPSSAMDFIYYKKVGWK